MNKQKFSLLIELIREVNKFDKPLDVTLSLFFRNHRLITPSDKHIFAETVYGIIRNYFKLKNANINKTLDQVVFILINNLKIDKKILISCGIKADFIDIITKLKINNQILEFPDEIITELKKEYSDLFIANLSYAMSKTAPLDLRVNTIKTNIAEVMDGLKEFNPQVLKYSSIGVRINDKAFLSNSQLFIDGKIEVQDEASQLASLLLSPKRGDMVVDFCAGSGGKTLALGQLMHNTGRIYAFDVNQKRLDNLSPRLKRSGLSNIQASVITNENDTKVKRLHNKIDKLFIDAPCSGLGTLRRNPELKFRNTLDKIHELNITQQNILDHASSLLKVGGRLVYATCSILKCENEDIVQNFLDTHDNFKLIPVYEVLKIEEFKDNDMLRLNPYVHKCDGFFAALIERVS